MVDSEPYFVEKKIDCFSTIPVNLLVCVASKYSEKIFVNRAFGVINVAPSDNASNNSFLERLIKVTCIKNLAFNIYSKSLEIHVFWFDVFSVLNF